MKIINAFITLALTREGHSGAENRWDGIWKRLPLIIEQLVIIYTRTFYVQIACEYPVKKNESYGMHLRFISSKDMLNNKISENIYFLITILLSFIFFLIFFQYFSQKP